MGDPSDPRESSHEGDRIMAWEEEHDLDLPGNAGMDLMDLIADLQKRAYEQGMSDGQQVACWKEVEGGKP